MKCGPVDEIRDESDYEKLEENSVLAENCTDLTLHKTRIGA
jgi:hypothetical protein